MIALALAAVLAIAPTPAHHPPRVYLPVLATAPRWMPATGAPPPTLVPLPTAYRPTTYEELRRAVAIPGARVIPAPGTYRPSRPIRLAPAVLLDGEGRVTIAGEGVVLHKAHGAEVRALTVVDADGDGIQVNGSTVVTIRGVSVRGSGDGEIDVTEAPPGGADVLIADSLIGPGRKCQLLGDQDESGDGQLRVTLQRVTFTACHVRVPKVHRARVTIEGGTVYHWTGPRLDVQLGGHVEMRGTTWIMGKDSLPGFHLPTGGTATETGGRLIPWKGAE